MSHDLPLAVALNGYGVTHDGPDGIWREMLRWDDLAGLGRMAERLGYRAIFAPEIEGREAFSTIAGFASVTDRIGLVSGVVPLASREDDVIAMGASSLFEQTGGRFILGLGGDIPLDSTRDRIETIRHLIRGEQPIVDTRGDSAVAVPMLDWITYQQPVPIWLAALGPRMVELGAHVADGLILNWCTPDRVAEARLAVPSTRDVAIAVYVRACIGPQEEQAVAALELEATRYVRLPWYESQFRRMGLWSEAEDRLGSRDRRSAKQLARRAVEATCLHGEADHALARLAEYRDAGADVVVVYPVAAAEAVSSLQGTMMALASDPALGS